MICQCLVVFILLGLGCATRPIVKTACGGSVEGLWLPSISADSSNTKAVAAFRGILFGTQKRFKFSQVRPCVASVFDASKNGPMCYQDTREFGTSVNVLPMSESCLNVNVFVPNLAFHSTSGAGFPVLVWLYGGGSVAGSNFWYPNIETLAETMQVIVVAPNYRLGALGFLALRELRAGAPSSGNYGTSDCLTALQWTSENVVSFGGDPNRITFLGQSSGATQILALLSNSKALKLLHGAILLSASANVTQNLESAEMANREGFLQRSACANASKVLQCLLALPAKEIEGIWPLNYVSPNPNFPSWMYTQGPIVIVDGVMVPISPLEAFSRGISIPVLLESAKCESEANFDPQLYATLENATNLEYEAFVTRKLSETNMSQSKQAWPSDALSLIRKEYPLPAYRAINEFYSDIGISLGMWAYGKISANSSAKVFIGRVECAPAKPFPISTKGGHFYDAAHMWDYIAATGPLNGKNWRTALIAPTSPDLAFYTPMESDFAFGVILRSRWKNLIFNGTLPKDWPSFAKGGDSVGHIYCSNVTAMPYSGRLNVARRMGVLQPWFWWAN